MPILCNCGTEVYIMLDLIFLSSLLRVIISIITKSFEYAILLLLILQKGLTALFNFDDG